MSHRRARPVVIPRHLVFQILLYTRERPTGYPDLYNVSVLNTYYRFKEILELSDALGCIQDPNMLAFTVPIAHLVYYYKFFTLKDLRYLCGSHGILFLRKSISALAYDLMYHQCTNACAAFVYVFKVLPSPRRVDIGVSDAIISRRISVASDTITGSVDLQVGEFSGAMHHDHRQLPTGADDIQLPYGHLEPLDSAHKFQLLKEWEHATCTETLAVVVCAACAIKTSKLRSSWISTTGIDLSLLTNSFLPEHLWPNSYNFELYGRALLHHKGMESVNSLGRLRICDRCLTSLKNGKMPKFSLANNLYYAHERLPPAVKLAFEQSTVYERTLISRARCNNICCKFSPSTKTDVNLQYENQTVLADARKGIKGNILVLPLDTIQMNRVIPPGPEVNRDTMCAIFVGNVMPTRDALLKRKVKPLLVRKSRLRIMIEFLMEFNDHYRPSQDFQFSSANLNNLFDGTEDEGIPSRVQIAHLVPSDAIIGSTSEEASCTDSVHVWDGDDGDVLMQNVGYTDGDDSPTNYLAMKALALEHCLLGRPYVFSLAGNSPISDFREHRILDWLFPHLDPWGIGGFFEPARRVRIGMQEQLSHMLLMADGIFERDPEFAFVFYNIVRKMNVAQSMRFTVSHEVHRNIARDLLAVDPEFLVELVQRIKMDKNYNPRTDEERRAFNLLNSVNMVARHIPGSNGYKAMLRHQIRSLVNYLGPPTLFITLNPADVDNPIVRVFAGQDISLEDVVRGEDMSWWDRRMFAAQHPAACVQFFHLIIENFINVVLKYHARGLKGLFGECTGYYGTVEAQGKGTLHCHMLIWLKGHLPPHLLHDAMSESVEYRDRVFSWMESIIKCEFPGTVGEPGFQPARRITCRDTGDPHPGTIPAPSPSVYGNCDEYWQEYKNYLIRLLHQYNWHIHNSTCWKYLRGNEEKSDKNCRLRMDGITRDTTVLDADSGGILIRRHHPKIASYTDCVTVMLKSNTEIKFIGSGTAARDLVYYITDYVTKPSLTVHAGLTALMYAIKKTSDNMAMRSSNLTNEGALSAVIVAVNSMMGRHEISQPQVMSYLIGGGDFYTSHTFAVVYWSTFLSYVDACVEYGNNAQEGPIEVSGDFQLHIRPGSISASHQLHDYIFRSSETEFDSLCLYDFVGYASKLVFAASHDVDTFHPGAFISWDHPQRSTHFLKRRNKFRVPVLLGPSIANPTVSDAHQERYAKENLILFKPWRNPVELLNGNATWLDAFQEFRGGLTERHQRIIDNFNAFTDSRDNRSSRRRERDRDVFSDEVNLPEGSESISGRFSLDDFEYSEAVLDLNVFSLIGSQDGVDDQQLEEIVVGNIGHDAVKGLELCFPNNPSVECGVDSATVVRDIDLTRLSQQSALMQLKRKRHGMPNGPSIRDVEEVRPNRRRRVENVHPPLARIMTVMQETGHHDKYTGVVEQVIEEMNLQDNAEQLGAFNIVANHLMIRSEEQLFVYVSGVGGTGKSHVIQSIVRLFEKVQLRQELILGAPTGIAAVLIGGHTLHSLILANPGGKPGSVSALVQIWRNVRYLIIDEVSMIGARFLSQLSDRIRQGKASSDNGSDRPFGGVNVIFMGDFGQLKPPKQYALYSHRIIKSPSFFVGSSVEGVGATSGIALWRQVTNVVELVKNQRQLEDVEYAAFLLRLREGKCLQAARSGDVDDLRYIRSRILTNLLQSPDELALFWDAPIIVGSKILRDALNAKMVRYHASRLGQLVNIYHSTDSVKRELVPEGLRSRLWNISSTKNKDSFGLLPLFVGMKVMITENLVFDNGIVNGSEGVVRSIEYKEDSVGRRFAAVVHVHIPGCGLQIPGLGLDVVPIFPVSTRIEYKFSTSTENVFGGFSRNQIPLVPAYAYTDFKAQGRTLIRAMVDIDSARGQGVYVMLSRVKSLKGLLVLQWFSPNKLYNRLPEELRDELNRLHSLSTNADTNA